MATKSQRDRNWSKLYSRLRKVGVDPADYECRKRDAKGICEACGNYSEVLVQDHCHVLNKPRGLICPGCNLALGHVKDDIERLCNLIDYLETYEELHSSYHDTVA